MSRHFFTSESVTEGHPDKICDQISDAILDALLEKDPSSRVACETTCTTGIVSVMGEITTNAYVDIQGIVRETVREIGYDRAKYGFDCDSCAVITSIDGQSADIALGVDSAEEQKEGSSDDADTTGAGDQGMMFGFACRETPELMPMPISFAHKLALRLTEVRKNGTLPYLRPDGKSQVTIEYEGNKPVRVEAVVISSQHSAEVSLETIREDIKKHVIDAIIPAELMDEIPRSSSTPPAVLQQADLTVTAALPDAKSLLIPTAVIPVMAAALFPEKTRPKLTAAQLMPQDGLQKTLLQQALQNAAKSSLHTPSALHIPFL